MSLFLHGNTVNPTERRSERRPDSGAIADASDLKLSCGAHALAEQIAKLWANELNLPAVGLDDNFFAIGGDSLSGVRVFLAVEQAYGKPLPEGALLGLSTVREMARRIETAESTSPEPPAGLAEDRLSETERRALAAVMALGSFPVARPGSAMKAVNTGGSRTPLFWCFNSPEKEMAGLAPHLDPDQPFYGLCSGGRLFTKSDAMMTKIAGFYAAEIMSLFPDGPYAIGGNCRGARVALMIARILMESGRRVEKICFLEYSGQDLYDFDGELLLMYGKLSHHRAYLAFRWGVPGWRTPFRSAPVVEWVSGAHGRFFQPHNIISLAPTLDRFLRALPPDTNPVSRLKRNFVMAIHKVPLLFHIYTEIFRLRDRVVCGKSVKINSFTGKPMA